MKVRSAIASSVIALSLALAACGEGDESSTEKAQSATPSSISTSEGPWSRSKNVGEKAGDYCQDDGTCLITFSVQDLQISDSCEALGLEPSEARADSENFLVRVDTRIETSRELTTPEIDDFVGWSRWNFTTSDGITLPAEEASRCFGDATTARNDFNQPIVPGDSVLRHELYVLPDNAETLRLTASDSSGYWEWKLPEASQLTSAPQDRDSSMNNATATPIAEPIPAAAPPTVVECLPGTPGPARWSDGTVAYSDTCYQQGVAQPNFVNEGDITQRFWECMAVGGTEEACRQ